MLTRIVTAVLAGSITLAAILWREPWGWLIVSVAIYAVGSREIWALLPSGNGWDISVSFFAVLPLFFEPGTPVQLLTLGLVWVLAVATLMLWRPNNIGWTPGLFMWVLCGVAAGLVLKLQFNGSGALTVNLLLLALLPLWVGDSLAYFVGKAIGRHKLAPSISPNKTWEGAIANLVGCLAAAYAIGIWLKLPVAASIAVGLTTGILGQIGDLLQSRIKRLANVKDSGSILPGHGGVLDRLDSFLFSAYPSLLALWLLAPEAFHVKQWPW